MKKLLIVQSSVRSNRAGDKVLEQLQNELVNYPDVKADVFDFREKPLPFFDAEVPSMPSFAPTDKNVIAFTEAVNAADTVLILSAEYNHSYTSVLKNAVDWVKPSVWENKQVAFIGYGFGGGSKAIEKTRLLLTEFLKAKPSDIEANLFLTKTVNFDGSAIDADAVKAEINKVLKEIAG